MTINELKEYQFGKFYTYGELAAGIIGALLAYATSLRGDSTSLFLLILFSAIALIGFVHFFYLITNKTYIQINNEGIKIFPKFFMGNTKMLNWNNISGIEKIVRKRITLNLSDGKAITINLGVLSKVDRESSIHLIKESTEKK